jgi:hypothetical protein
MKSILTLAALVGLVACSTANAASLQVVKSNGDQTNAIYLVGEAQNGLFNTVKLDATPSDGAAFQALNSGLDAGVPRPAGQQMTYLNRQLNADPLDGGLGWSLLGTATTANSLAFSGGPLGSNITTADQAGGRLFLGNVQLPLGAKGVALVQLSDAAGSVVADLTADLGVPEPATFGLVSMSLLGLFAARRRS